MSSDKAPEDKRTSGLYRPSFRFDASEVTPSSSLLKVIMTNVKIPVANRIQMLQCQDLLMPGLILAGRGTPGGLMVDF